jgi:hypothetical protein
VWRDEEEKLGLLSRQSRTLSAALHANYIATAEILLVILSVDNGGHVLA